MPFDETLVDKGHYFYQPVEGQDPPLVGDGVTYSRALGWQSPEGNFYGQERWVRDWPSPIVWDGEDYRVLEIDGAVDSLAALALKKPPYRTPASFEIWSVPRANWPPTNIDVYDGRDKEYYFWNVDTQDFQLIEWYWTLDDEDDLPRPGLKVGAAHVLYYYDIKVMWDGLVWKRYSLDMIEGGERVDAIESNYDSFITNTNGAIQTLEDTIDGELRSRIAEARLEFVSKSALSLVSSVRGNTGALWVGGELLLVEDVANAINTSQAIHYDNNTITYVDVTVDTEYYVYCGNSEFVDGPTLFLSLTPDISGKLGTVEPGSNARIVGVVEIDDQGYFRREIDMSYIGKRVEFSETFWEYSDYTLSFTDQDTLSFNKLYGTSGLCYINGQLFSLGNGRELLRESFRIDWNNANIRLDETAIQSSTIYQIYIANDSYEFNFNDVGEDGFPLDEGDVGYESAKDFRRSLFLSTKENDNRLLDQQYPGYYARHIGQVATDSLGYFKYSNDISLIRQPTLNPTSLDGLAEITFLWEASSQIGIITKRGTNGLVYVNGERLTVDGLNCSYINTASNVYSYNGGLSSPLDIVQTVEDYVGRTLYLYITNNNTVWGSYTNSLICSNTEPVGGYMDSNYPGNNCRWIGTVRQAPIATGSDMVINGNFTDDTEWIYDRGWFYDDVNDKMTHVSGILPLTQDVTLTNSQLYKVVFTISDRTTGDVKVSLGGAESASLSSNAIQDVNVVAGTGDYIYFIPSQTFDGSIDDVSIRLTSVELVVNGDCASDANWTKGTGWTYDSANKHYDHAALSDWLTQDITLINSSPYLLTFDLAKTSGTSITPCLGGTNGSAITTAGAKSVSISAGSSDYLRFIASSDFVGTIDNVALSYAAPTVNNSGWTTDGVYWTILYGIPTHVYAEYGGAGTLEQSLALISGHSYSVTFTYSPGYTASIYVKLGGTAGTTRSSAGTFTETITAGSSGAIEFISTGELSNEHSSTIESVSITDVTAVTITNADFAASEGWACSTRWSIGSGVASHEATPNYLTQDITLSNGSTYKVNFTTAGRTAGSVTPVLSGTSGSAITANQANALEMTAGADNYMRFIASDDYDGNIDDISIKLTGPDIATNGSFAADEDWEYIAGWVWDGTSYHMDHVPEISFTISQDIDAVENEYYELTFSLTNYVAGTITPYIGGVEGSPESTNGYKTQHILAGDSGEVGFISSPLFDGSLDSVSVRKTLGVFENSFLSESVAGISAAINDSVVSYSDTWSSAKIMAEIQKVLGITSAEQTFENQKIIGASIRLEYVSASTVRLIPTIENARIYFSVDPNDYLDMPSGGLSLSISGSAGSLYYVWLEKENFYMNTNAPTDEYTKMSMRGDAVLVGYIACSGSNAISGDWNVYSFWKESTKQWSSGTINSDSFIFTKTGLLVPPNGSAIVSRTGSTTVTGTAYSNPYNPYSPVSASASTTGLGTAVYTLPSIAAAGGYYNNYITNGPFSGEFGLYYTYTMTDSVSAGTGNAVCSVSIGPNVSPGIYNSVTLTVLTNQLSTALYYWGGGLGQTAPNVTHTRSITSRTGNLVITRQGNM